MILFIKQCWCLRGDVSELYCIDRHFIVDVVPLKRLVSVQHHINRSRGEVVPPWTEVKYAPAGAAKDLESDIMRS